MRGAIVYISSNREHPEFENKIITDMLSKKGDLPVYSVSQKYMYFGLNKCVGDVGTSGFNFCRQLQMVVDMADADYVISCEADCLYSPDYFKFVPKDLNKVYRNTNNYVIPHGELFFYKKDSQTAFQIAGRKFLLDRLNYLLNGQPQWNTKMKNFPKEIGEKFLDDWDTFKTKYACFQIKTGQGMRKQTKHGKDGVAALPHWGRAKRIKDRFL